MSFTFLFLPPQSEITHEWALRLAAAVPEARVVVAEDADEARRDIIEADAAFGTPTPELLRPAERLRWLQAPAAAPPAGYYFPELVAHPLTVTNFRGIYNDHIAAHILSFVLGFARGLHRYIPQQMRQEWKPLPGCTVHLPEATALVVGVGGVGGEAARLLASFGVKVLGVDARREDRPEGVWQMHPPSALDGLLPRADFVILTVPHTPATEGLIDARRLKLMKSGAFLINIGRGATVRLADLNDALWQKVIAGAALDVFEDEPLPPGHPLWSAPNTVLTPHVAGEGPYLNERRLQVIVNNARRFAHGEPLLNVVDKNNWF